MESLEELAAVGAFISGPPVQRQIKFTIEGKEYEATVHIVRRSLGAQERMFAAVRRQTDPREAAATIATLVRFGKNADETISVERASMLHPSLADALLNAISEVEGLPKA